MPPAIASQGSPKRNHPASSLRSDSVSLRATATASTKSASAVSLKAPWAK